MEKKENWFINILKYIIPIKNMDKLKKDTEIAWYSAITAPLDDIKDDALPIIGFGILGLGILCGPLIYFAPAILSAIPALGAGLASIPFLGPALASIPFLGPILAKTSLLTGITALIGSLPAIFGGVGLRYSEFGRHFALYHILCHL